MPSAGLAQRERFKFSTATKVQPQAESVLQSFPDAPSVRASPQDEKLCWFGKAESALDVLANRNVTRDTIQLSSPGSNSRFHALHDALPRNELDSFLDKYLYSSPLKNATNHSSISGSLLSRSTDAASHVVITQNDSGERVVNVRYLLVALTSAAVDTAHRPYWAQSTSGTFSDFGSSLGSDAGMNVFREFQPSIRKMLESHSPIFVKKFESIAKD